MSANSPDELTWRHVQRALEQTALLCLDAKLEIFDYAIKCSIQRSHLEPGLKDQLCKFVDFQARARARMIRGWPIFGDAWRTRDNVDEGKEEACDLANYALFAMLMAREGAEG